MTGFYCPFPLLLSMCQSSTGTSHNLCGFCHRDENKNTECWRFGGEEKCNSLIIPMFPGTGLCSSEGSKWQQLYPHRGGAFQRCLTATASSTSWLQNLVVKGRGLGETKAQQL